MQQLRRCRGFDHNGVLGVVETGEKRSGVHPLQWILTLVLLDFDLLPWWRLFGC